MPKAVAEAGLAAAREAKADGLIAVGGGSAIGLAKAIARDTALPIIAVPTTYSGSEATTIFGISEGARKVTGRDVKVLPRTIIYDPDLTLDLPAGGERGERHERDRPLRREFLGGWPHPGHAGAGERGDAAIRRAICRPSSPTAPTARRARNVWSPPGSQAPCSASATALQHKLAHVLGGLGLPHAQAHAIILPHVTRFNLQAAPEAKARLAQALGSDDPAEAIADMLRKFPIPQRLRDIGFDAGKTDFVAGEIAAQSITSPRPVASADVRELLNAAY